MPAPKTSRQWDLVGQPIDQSFDVDMCDIALFEADASLVQSLHAQGSKVVCYISVGSWETWRSDADEFPDSFIGNDYAGWPDERWLDMRRIEPLAPIMSGRLDQCGYRHNTRLVVPLRHLV